MGDIYKLKLHETYHEDNGNVDITRVPGGWLYHYTFRKSTTFVAYTNEFDPQVEIDNKAAAAARSARMAAMMQMKASSAINPPRGSGISSIFN